MENNTEPAVEKVLPIDKTPDENIVKTDVGAATPKGSPVNVSKIGTKSGSRKTLIIAGLVVLIACCLIVILGGVFLANKIYELRNTANISINYPNSLATDLPLPTDSVPEQPANGNSTSDITPVDVDTVTKQLKSAIFPIDNEGRIHAADADYINIARQLVFDKDYNFLAASADGKLILASNDFKIAIYTNTNTFLTDTTPKFLSLAEAKVPDDFIVSWSDARFSSNNRYVVASFSWLKVGCDAYECIPGTPDASDISKYGLFSGEVITDLVSGDQALTKHPSSRPLDDFSSFNFSADNSHFFLLEKLEDTKAQLLRFDLNKLFEKAADEDTYIDGQKFSVNTYSPFLPQFHMISKESGIWRFDVASSSSKLMEVKLANGKVNEVRTFLNGDFTATQFPKLIGKSIFVYEYKGYIDFSSGQTTDYPAGYDYLTHISENEVVLAKYDSIRKLETIATYNLKTKAFKEIRYTSNFYTTDGDLYNVRFGR